MATYLDLLRFTLLDPLARALRASTISSRQMSVRGGHGETGCPFALINTDLNGAGTCCSHRVQDNAHQARRYDEYDPCDGYRERGAGHVLGHSSLI